MDINEVTSRIIGAAMRVHSALGPGLREDVYEAALAAELRKEGCQLRQQLNIPITIDGRRFEKAARADLVVDGLVVVEVKAQRAIGLHDIKQVLTYLKLLHLPIGLILNFNAPSMREGIKRVANGYMQ